MPRLIPDSECVQSKCARKTSGCWDECEMRRSPAMYGLPTPGAYTVTLASPVQGAASMAGLVQRKQGEPARHMVELTQGAASSASGESQPFGKFHTRHYPDGSTYTFETRDDDPDSFPLYRAPVGVAAKGAAPVAEGVDTAELDADTKLTDLMLSWSNASPGAEALAAYDAITEHITTTYGAQQREAGRRKEREAVAQRLERQHTWITSVAAANIARGTEPALATQPAEGLTVPTNDEVFAEVRRQRGGRPCYVSTNAVNDTMAAVRAILAQQAKGEKS